MAEPLGLRFMNWVMFSVFPFFLGAALLAALGFVTWNVIQLIRKGWR